MEQIEKLRELKLAYEYLLDIRDNTPSLHTKQAMNTAINEISEVYYNVYNEMPKSNITEMVEVVNTDTKERFMLSPTVEGDYIDKNGYPYTCGDADFFWYEHSVKEICPEKMEVLFTFGSWEKFPYQNGYIIIKAYTLEDAIIEFRQRFPDVNKNTLCCADYYYSRRSIGEVKQLYGEDACYEVIDATETLYNLFDYDAVEQEPDICDE